MRRKTFSEIKEFMRKNKDNCPFCEAETEGESSSWGMSDEGWQQLEERHKKYHEKGQK